MQLSMALEELSATGLGCIDILKLGDDKSILYCKLWFISIEFVNVINKPIKYILRLKFLKVFNLLVDLGLDIQLRTLLVNYFEQPCALFDCLSEEYFFTT